MNDINEYPPFTPEPSLSTVVENEAVPEVPPLTATEIKALRAVLNTYYFSEVQKVS